jgi:hypothetical protein
VYTELYAPNRRVTDYQFCYLLMLLAERTYTGESKRHRQLETLGQYYVAHRLYSLLVPQYRRSADLLLDALGAKAFRKQYPAHLKRLKDVVAITWQSFFKEKRDKDEDPLSFVTTTATKKAWNAYWRSRSNAGRRKKAMHHLTTLGTSLTRR